MRKYLPLSSRHEKLQFIDLHTKKAVACYLTQIERHFRVICGHSYLKQVVFDKQWRCKGHQIKDKFFVTYSFFITGKKPQ